MGYEDELYKAENIIGITGPVFELPTVYFWSSETFRAGHITQVHASTFNQGRCQPYEPLRNYQIINECGGSCKCKKATAHEFLDGNFFHPSRAAFVPFNDLNEKEQGEVPKCLMLVQHRKSDPFEFGVDKAPDYYAKEVWAGHVAAMGRDAEALRNLLDDTADDILNPHLVKKPLDPLKARPSTAGDRLSLSPGVSVKATLESWKWSNVRAARNLFTNKFLGECYPERVDGTVYSLDKRGEGKSFMGHVRRRGD